MRALPLRDLWPQESLSEVSAVSRNILSQILSIVSAAHLPPCSPIRRETGQQSGEKQVSLQGPLPSSLVSGLTIMESPIRPEASISEDLLESWLCTKLMTKTRKGLLFFSSAPLQIIYISLRTDRRAILSLLSARSPAGMCPASSLAISLRRPRSHLLRKDPVLIEFKVGRVLFPPTVVFQ